MAAQVFSVKDMFYLSALLLMCSVVKEGQSALTPTLDCRVVLCALPDCDPDDQIPPKPGQCCPTCPNDPTTPPSTPPLRCPTLPKDTFGLCVELCSGNDGCPEGQLCCSNGCGHVCTDGVPDVCELNGKEYQVGESFPAGDGCNTCTCSTGGLIACTEKACITVPPPPPTCPPDKPMVYCFVDPCMFATCPAHPNAQCVSDYCGGCNARFFVKGKEVTDTCHDVCVRGDKVYNIGDSFPAGDGCNRCSCIRPNRIVCTLIACPPPTTPPPPPPTCPPDKPIVNCFVDPCMFAKCPAHPNAQCVSDYCGGCNARFFEDGKEVTDTCDCPVKGQIFNKCGSACPPNCTTPNPICTLQCVSRCECPRGEVINQVTNTCVRLSQCPSDPPTTPPPPPPTCPPDKPMVYCFVDPCMFAKCPAHPNAQCVSDYCGGCNARFFEDGKEVTDTCDCPVIGQIFNECGSACPPNCTTPNPICTRQCVSRCECPRGKVINEVTNKCVRQSLCPLPETGNCPPTCTASFCKKNFKALCSKPGPREIPGCTGSCQVTFCHACYYSSEIRPLPGNCRTCGAPVSSRRCLNRWANCILKSDFLVNGHLPCEDQTQEKFKCYQYPCPLKG